jgi:1A family penicillin-binding protein
MARRRSQARKKNKGFFGNLAGPAKKIFFLGLVVGCLGLGYIGAKVWKQLQDFPDVTMVERFEPIEAIQLYDGQDRLICTVEGDEDRRVVPLNQISNHMQQAILAAEDHHFFEHNGINFFSIIRAFLANMQAGHVVEGGSTITQQLAKNLFFSDSGRTVDRKVKEAYVAWELERRYSKERILNMYLNQVYFGNNAYGIERAASRYFDKPATRLSIAESAFLAGLVKAPSELGTVKGRSQATSRQRDIIDKMVEYGYITQKQAEEAKNQKLSFKKGVNPLQKYPYYISYVLECLRERFSQAEMRRQGLRVYTNLDTTAQELAENALNAGIKKAPKGVSQGALVSVRVSDGAVVAMVGGVGDFWKNQFNRATNPHTVGSSFKPFVYLTAFNKNAFSPDSMIDDSPLVIHQPWGLPDYAPKNFDRKFYGRITIRRALALSRNVPAVKVGQQVGMDSVIETARLAGLTAKLDPNLSLALGSSAASPLEMAGAYSTFARFGVTIKPQVIRKIEDNRGRVIEVFDPKVDRAFQVEPIARLVDCMQDVVKWGTGTQAKLADRPVAGKTGTADEGRDIWFIGFTPDMVTAVWGGNDENKPIEGKNVTGGVIMAKIWHDYNEAYYKARPTPPGNFMVPSPISPDENKPAGEQVAKGEQGAEGDNTAQNGEGGNSANGESDKSNGDSASALSLPGSKPGEPSGVGTEGDSGKAPLPGGNGGGAGGSGGSGIGNSSGGGSSSSSASGSAGSSNSSGSSGSGGAGSQTNMPPLAPPAAPQESEPKPAPSPSEGKGPQTHNPDTVMRLYPYNQASPYTPAR